ncbi:hypothetical protein [Pseudomonas alkylphenolica]|uniref:hypothetical protein n=1 Tax=Pseudomonas alkylphenolica TaxID=237609 RepID=UPI0018D70BE9|nr:hypothetical protein [Pseudomonas alkylphenolica]
MSESFQPVSSRADFHARYQRPAREQAAFWFAQRARLQGAWLNWVATELYQLSPPEYASMVRRELQALTGQ